MTTRHTDLILSRRGLPRIAMVLLGLNLLLAGPAASQQASTVANVGDLPTVIYPLRDPSTGSPDNGTPTPPPAQVTDEPAPVQYNLAGDVWGYWDRDQHFHLRPDPAGHGPAERPSNAIAIQSNGIRPAPIPHVETRGQPLPRYGVGLSNSPPRTIVVRPLGPRDMVH